MSYINKKVKNAQALTVDGIEFKSAMEAKVYKRLVELGITPTYEYGKIVLQEGFRPKHPWFVDGKLQCTKSGTSNFIHALTYTPDFRIEYKGYIIFLEVKGFITDRYPLKRKMFLRWLDSDDRNIIFAEVKTLKGLNSTIEQIDKITEQSYRFGVDANHR